MGVIHQQLMRALIAGQVGVLEHADLDVGDHDGSNDVPDALAECHKEIGRLIKKLRKEG
jgi:hypothetical protein